MTPSSKPFSAEKNRPFTAERRRFSAPDLPVAGPPPGDMAEQIRVMMSAIDKLEGQVGQLASALAIATAEAGQGRVTGPVLQRIKAAAGEGQKLDGAAAELSAVINTTERATDEILGACEAIDAIAAEALEGFADEGAPLAVELGRIRDYVVQIFQAASFQDLTGQRLSKVTKMLITVDERLREVENAVGVMPAADDAAGVAEPEAAVPAKASLDPSDPHFDESALLNGPAAEGQGISQDDIDKLFG
jgi:chemotaxis protein CheZ